jgi:hypothetical protein
MTTKKADWRNTFLTALAESGNVTLSAKRAGIARQHAYLIRKQDPDFAAQWGEAMDIAVGGLEDEAFRRAVKGKSDTLLIFLLKAHRPDVYRENLKIDLSAPWLVMDDGDPD